MGWRRRAASLLLWALAMALGGVLIARGHYSADLSAFLPASPDARQQLLIEQLQSGVAARTLMLAIDGGGATPEAAAARAEASRALAARLRATGLFEQVQNGDTAEWGGEGGAGEWMVAHRFQLSPAVDAAHFSVEGLRSAIDDTLSLLGTPAGALVKPLLERDPTGDTQRIVESLIPSQAPRSQNGVWVSRERPRALLLAQTRAAGGDLDAQAAALARIDSEWAAAAAAQPAFRALAIKVSGTPRFSVNSRTRIEAEVRFLAIAGTLLMGALLLLAFGAPQALAVAFLPVGTGVVAGICAVSLGFGTVHGITLGFGSTLIGEAVDYAIYYLIQARGAVRRGEAAAGAGWRAWLGASWPTVRLGLLTSVCGFSALVFSGFPGLAQLGVFSLSGLLAAALTARWVLPALMPDGAAGRGLRGPLGRATAWAVARLPRLRWPLLAAGALVLAVLLVQRGALWRGDLGSLSPVPRAELDLDAELRADLSASDSRTLVAVQGADADAALAAAEAAGAPLDALQRGRDLVVRQPDGELLASAKSGKLTQDAELRKQVKRMITDERFSGFVNGFLDSWLNLRDLGGMPPPRESFRYYYAEDLPTSMKAEARLFFQDLMKNNGSVAQFIDADYSFVDKKLAKLYELPEAKTLRLADGFQKVSLKGNDHRGGLLGYLF